MKSKNRTMFELYDDLAVLVVSSKMSNDSVDLKYTNLELSENICSIMEWETFDLFETHDFQEVMDADEADKCLAYAFISFLRWRLFTEARKLGIGPDDFNINAAVYSEYWYIKLVERWSVLSGSSVSMKNWIN